MRDNIYKYYTSNFADQIKIKLIKNMFVLHYKVDEWIRFILIRVLIIRNNFKILLNFNSQKHYEVYMIQINT